MKLPDLNPLVLLSAGAVTGALFAAIFFPNAAQLPGGWGDVAGSALGVFGAYFVARATFKSEQKAKKIEAMKPLLAKLKITQAATNNCIEALTKNQEPFVELSNYYMSSMTVKNCANLERIRQLSPIDRLSLDNFKMVEKLDEIFAPIRKLSANKIEHESLYKVAIVLPGAIKAAHSIKDELEKHLEPHEILWFSDFIDVLNRAQEMDNDISSIIYEMPDFSAFSPPAPIEGIRYTLDVIPNSMLSELKRHKKHLVSVIERLEN